MQKQDQKPYNIPSVSKVDAILDYLAENGESTLSQIYVDLDFPKSSTYKLLKTLESRRYIRYQPITQTYLLGMKLLELGSKASEQIDITAIATPILKELSLKVNRLCHLGVLDGDHVVYVMKTSTNELIKIGTWIGRRIGAHCTAMGKVLLAWKSNKEIERFLDDTELERMTPNTIVDKDQLRESLLEVRRNGWSLDDEESTKMVRAVGAPIRDQSGAVCAGLSICTLTEIDDLEELLTLKDTAIEAANKISTELGWRP